jgi:hypothetical protein
MEMLYGVLGGFMARRASLSTPQMAWMFGLIGLLATLAYDVVTNAVTGVLFYQGMALGSLFLPNWAEGIVIGIPMSMIHVVSNLVQFTLVAPALVVESNRAFFRRMGELA